jgi:hypothetical protein
MNTYSTSAVTVARGRESDIWRTYCTFSIFIRIHTHTYIHIHAYILT